jgi:hypothetical protein
VPAADNRVDAATPRSAQSHVVCIPEGGPEARAQPWEPDRLGRDNRRPPTDQPAGCSSGHRSSGGTPLCTLTHMSCRCPRPQSNLVLTRWVSGFMTPPRSTNCHCAESAMGLRQIDALDVPLVAFGHRDLVGAVARCWSWAARFPHASLASSTRCWREGAPAARERRVTVGERREPDTHGVELSPCSQPPRHRCRVCAFLAYVGRGRSINLTASSRAASRSAW